jgi:hypothetical protein
MPDATDVAARPSIGELAVTREWFGSDAPDATPLDHLRTRDDWRSVKVAAFKAGIPRVEMSIRDGAPTLWLGDRNGNRIAQHTISPGTDPARLFTAARRGIKRLTKRAHATAGRRVHRPRSPRRTHTRRRRASARGPDREPEPPLAARRRP